MVTCAVANGSADYCATTTAKPRKTKASEFMDSTGFDETSILARLRRTRSVDTQSSSLAS
jgi:hypothetical protein